MIVTKKTIDKLAYVMNDASGSKVSDFARRQLEKFGWSEGKGLGKNEDGMSKHIKIKKLDDNIGLGSDKAASEKETEHWWHDAFDKALKDNTLSKKGKKRDRQNPTVPSAPPSFDELFKATGGARLGMRARADQQGKWIRTEQIDLSITENNKPEITSLHKEIKGNNLDIVNNEKLEKKVKRSKKRNLDNVEPSSDDLININQNNDCVTTEEKAAKKKRKKEKKSKLL